MDPMGSRALRTDVDGSDTERARPLFRVRDVDEQRWRHAWRHRSDMRELAAGPAGGSARGSRHGRMGRCVAVSRSGRRPQRQGPIEAASQGTRY